MISGFELESVTTTQNVYKQTMTTKTHIESVAEEIISIDSDKDHKANVTREIVLPELFETGIKYPASQYKVYVVSKSFFTTILNISICQFVGFDLVSFA